MIGESDRYDPERAKQMKADMDEWSYYTTMDPYSVPKPSAIGSSSLPFEGDVKHLLKFCNETVEHCTDENWDGCHVAVNAKSDSEAEVHDTHGRVRLVVATEIVLTIPTRLRDDSRDRGKRFKVDSDYSQHG
jgi:hypothetical protein